MLLCQISDLHVVAGRALAYGVVDTASCLERCLRAILQLDPRPDAVVATGDLVDVPDAASYGLLRELLARLAMPVYLLPGNHDDRAALTAAFGDHAYLPRDGGFVQYEVDLKDVRLLALDSLVPGRPGGLLCERRLQWLERRLCESDAPTIVALHHPPFATGIEHMDRMALANGEALEAIVRRFPQVQRIICGHVHRPIQTLFGGALASVCPSTAHQVVLDLSVSAKARLNLEPAAFQLHRWNGRSVVTHTAYTAQYDGPYPFS